MPQPWSPFRLTSDGRTPVVFGTFLLLIYMAGTLYVGLHHEPWRDEADVWLAARDMSVAEAIPAWTAQEGSPALWFLLVKLLTSAGLPYVSMTILHLVLAWIAAAVLVFLAPFTPLTKLLLLASYYLGYEYAVIARSYVLTVLLLFVAASAFRKRPVVFAISVALLFNTNVHGAVIAAILAACFAVTNRSPKPLAIAALGALIAFLQLRGGSGNAEAMRARLYAIPFAVKDAFLPDAPTLFAALGGVAVLIAIVIALRRDRIATAFLVATVVALLAIFAFVWYGGLRHAGLLLIVAVTAIWIAAEVPETTAARVAGVLLNVTLLVSAAYMFVNARTDVSSAFSGSREMAQFIDHRFDDSAIAAHNMYAAEAVLPYLPERKFWYPTVGRFGTFVDWTIRDRLRYEDAASLARKHFAGKKWLLLVNAPMPDPARHGFRLIHATSVAVFRHPDERYWLYAPL